ncbi:hypothetical protein V500_00903 [Pseudogymnoascus sp. VKM F-4518 (FW-2643)]|nr:hypothetical protein V500_00903 [Pseudogymnoascus sp. VKM F-4518 (FW-2643)]
MSLPAPIIQCAFPSIQDPLIVFRSPTSSPKEVQDAVHRLSRHVAAAAKDFDSTLCHVAMIPILRGAMPMFVATQSMFDSCACILVRCHKRKGSNEVFVEWLGRSPFPPVADDGRLVILDTIIATGDTIVQLCDELWETSGHATRSVVIMACYAAPEALEKVAKHPIVQYVVVAQKANSCDPAGYLVPYTHGDIGDKLFGVRRQEAVVVAEGQDVGAVTAGIESLLMKNGGLWTLTQDGTGIEREIQFQTFKAAWVGFPRHA